MCHNFFPGVLNEGATSGEPGAMSFGSVWADIANKAGVC